MADARSPGYPILCWLKSVGLSHCSRLSFAVYPNLRPPGQRLVNHKFGELQNLSLGLIREATGTGQFGDAMDN
jgi:hypothetical protein